jgi:hypothetical protein
MVNENYSDFFIGNYNWFIFMTKILSIKKLQKQIL